MYSGYPTQSGQTSGGYYSGFVNADGGVISARGAKGSQKPMCFLINAGTAGIHSMLAGLQAAGKAAVVQEGEAAMESGVGEYSMTLTDGVTALVRTSELVNPDGSIGFRPDVTAPLSPESSPDSSPAMTAALKAARGETAIASKGRSAVTPGAAKKGDKPYTEMTYPTAPYRLLALFRFWNIINYFFPYKHLSVPKTSSLCIFRSLEPSVRTLTSLKWRSVLTVKPNVINRLLKTRSIMQERQGAEREVQCLLKIGILARDSVK